MSEGSRCQDKGQGSLSVIMPAFNEEKNLETAVVKTVAALDVLLRDYEIIIVNDGSSDRTREVGEALAVKFSQVKYVQHEKNQGIGYAFRTGVSLAMLDYVILIPADNPPVPDDLRPFVAQLGACDLIVGFREKRVGYTPLLAFLSWFYNRVLIPALFGIRLKDVNWIQAYRRTIFGKGGVVIEYPGIFFFAEVLVKSRRIGATVVEVPSKMQKRIHGRPTISRFPVIMKTLKDAWSLFFRLHGFVGGRSCQKD